MASYPNSTAIIANIYLLNSGVLSAQHSNNCKYLPVLFTFLTVVSYSNSKANIGQYWPKPSCGAQWKGEEDKSDRGRGGKTKSGNEQAWTSPRPRGQWRTGKNGGIWLWNHLWCPNDPGGQGIDDDDDDDTCLHNSQSLEHGKLVSWCFKPSQPQRIKSGLRETFIKRYIVERTNKAEIGSEEQNEKMESCQETL